MLRCVAGIQKAMTCHLSAWFASLLVSLTLLLALSAHADTATSIGDLGGEGLGPFGGLAQSPEANLFTGAMSLSVPILIPPARKNATPDLKLVYSSAAGDGAFGYGWDLPLGSIERSTKKGVPSCNTPHDYILMLNGGAHELVHVGSYVYRPRIDEAYAEAVFNPSLNTWEVANRAGMRFRFGTDESARLAILPDAHSGPPNPPCLETMVWGLTQIEDPNGNTIDLRYLKDGNALYPLEILYGDDTMADQPFKVSFETEARTYPTISYQRGAQERRGLIVRYIKAWYRATAGASFDPTPIRTYTLTYQNVAEGGRTLLTRVQGTLLPTQDFEYSTSSFGFTEQSTVSSPDGKANLRHSDSTDGEPERSIMDMNGDGMVDLVQANNGNGTNWRVHLGTRTGFQGLAEAMPWGTPSGVLGEKMREADPSGGLLVTKKETVDLTGDGVVDFVDATQSTWEANNGKWLVYPGRCTSATTCSFTTPAIPWDAPGPYLGEEAPGETQSETWKMLIDVNGDGLVDVLHKVLASWSVWLNRGPAEKRFEAVVFLTHAAGPIAQQSKEGGVWNATRSWFDVNGDGLPDEVTRYGSNRIRVYYHRGWGYSNVADVELVTPDGFSAVRRFEGATGETLIDFLDVNADGLPDRVYYGWQGEAGWRVQLNQGGVLEPLDSLGAPPRIWPGAPNAPIRDSKDGTTKIDVFDWNGDGILDWLKADSQSTWSVLTGAPQGSALVRSSLLVRAKNGLRGITDVRYQPSTDLDNGGDDGAPDLPFVTWVTTGTRRTDGTCDAPTGIDVFNPIQNTCIPQGRELVKTIAYEGGLFEANDLDDPASSREFRGFRMVVETRVPDGNTREVTFSQDTYTRGRIELEELYAGALSEPVRRGSFVWMDKLATLDSLRHQVYLAEQRAEENSVPYDSNLTQCLLNRNEPPDDYGRVTKTCSLPCNGAPSAPNSCASPIEGQVNTRTIWSDPSGTSAVRERPRNVIVEYRNAAGIQRLTQKWFKYDNLAAGQVAAGNVTSVTSELEQSFNGDTSDPEVVTGYDGFGNITSVKDPKAVATTGQPSTNVYDSVYFSLYPVREVAPTTNSVAHEVDTVRDLRYGKPTRITGENEEVVEYSYDALGRLSCEALPGDSLAGCKQGGSFTRSTEYDYSYAGGGSIPFESKLSYVEVRRREPNALGGYLRERIFFDALGRERARTADRAIDCSSAQTVVTSQTTYDAGGRVSKVFAPYVKVGYLVENPSHAHTLYDYELNDQNVIDPLGRVHKQTPPDGHATTTLYRGIETRVLDPLSNETRISKDAFGREVRKELYDQSTRKMDFRYAHDGLGRLLSSSVYDDQGNPVTTIYTYDRLGQRVTMTDPDSGTWKYAYDKNGNLNYQDDPKIGQHLQSSYDALNRTENRCIYTGSDAYVADDCTAAAGGAVESSYSYDQGQWGIGRLTGVADTSSVTGSEAITYDARGRITESIKAISGFVTQTSFVYDEADHVEVIGYPDGEQVGYTYDGAGQVKSLGGNQPYAWRVCYDIFGRANLIEHGNGADDVFGYYGGGESFRLQSIVTNPPSGTAHLNLSYSYEERGKVDTINDPRDSAGNLSNVATYDYDGLGRLGTVTATPGGAHDESFDYNALGNVTLKNGQSLGYSQTPHQASSYGNKLMGYDENGNRETKVATDLSATQEYSYNALLQLTQVRVGSGFTITHTVDYVYDYAGRRVAKTVSGEGTTRYFNQYAESRTDLLIKYYWIGDRLIASATVANGGFSEMLPGAPRRVEPWSPPPEGIVVLGVVFLVLLAGPGRRQIRIGVAVSASRALGTGVALLVATSPFLLAPQCGPPGGGNPPVVRHFHLDHLGSIQAITDGVGALVTQIRYWAYGEIRGRFDGAGTPIAPGAATRFEYTGYETEVESGLEYAGARFYDPELGQFLTHDPARQFASPYAYGPWDPLNVTDPTGALTGVEILVGALIAGAIAGAVAAIDAYIQSGGDTSVTAKAFGLGFASGFAAGLVLGPIAGSNPASALGQFAKTSFQLASYGYGAYGTARSFNDGFSFGAVYSAYGTLSAAFAFGESPAGDMTSACVSGECATDIPPEKRQAAFDRGMKEAVEEGVPSEFAAFENSFAVGVAGATDDPRTIQLFDSSADAERFVGYLKSAGIDAFPLEGRYSDGHATIYAGAIGRSKMVFVGDGVSRTMPFRLPESAKFLVFHEYAHSQGIGRGGADWKADVYALDRLGRLP